MHRTPTLIRAALAAALLAAGPARAAVPQVMTYTGYLKTAGGAPVTTSTNLTFSLYSASTGGAALWQEGVSATPSADGWFSVVLGTTPPGFPTSVFNQDPLYLGILVAGDAAELAPRARVTAGLASLSVDAADVQNIPGCGAGQMLTSTAGVLSCSATVTNASQLNGQPAGFYQPASTAITTGNIATQTVATAQTANAVAAGSITPSDLSGAAPAAGQVPIKAATDTWTWVSPITSVVAGAGIAGGGSSGAVTVAANFTAAGGTNGVATSVARGDHRHDGGVAGVQVNMSGASVAIAGASTAFVQLLSLSVAAGTSNSVAFHGHLYAEKSTTLAGRYQIIIARGTCAGVVVGTGWFRSVAPTTANDGFTGDTQAITGFDTGVSGTQTYVLCMQKFDATGADVTVYARGLTANWSP